MTKTEVDRFRAVLTTRVAELERVTRQRDAITVSDAPINWTRFRRLQSAHSRFLTSTVNLTNFETPVRRSAVSRKAALGRASSAMRTSTRSGLPRCPGPHFVYSARKP